MKFMLPMKTFTFIYTGGLVSAKMGWHVDLLECSSNDPLSSQISLSNTDNISIHGTTLIHNIIISRGVNSGWPGPVRPKPAKPVNI
ncbi:hypothetical protein YC2023_100114 [Brassica napus]